MAGLAAAAWNDKETLLLIELWGDQSIQAMLEGCVRNRHVYDRLSRELEEAGYKRSWSQIRDKLKKLKEKYKKVKDHNNETGRERMVWKFYEEMDAILGTKPAIRPEFIIDTLEYESEDIEVEVETGETIKVDMGKEVEKESEVNNVEKNQKNEVKKEADENKKGGVKTEVDENQKRQSKSENDKKRNRKTKDSSGSRVERALTEVVEIVTQAQSKSDELFVNLEEKRMKLDEQILLAEERRLREDKEREDRRWKEDRDRDERQRREEREFQMQLAMMMQRMPPPLPYRSPSSHYDN